MSVANLAFLWPSNCCPWPETAPALTTTMTTTTNSPSPITGDGNSNIDTNSSDASTAFISPMTPPCPGCSDVTTRSKDSHSQGHSDENRSSLTSGESVYDTFMSRSQTSDTKQRVSCLKMVCHNCKPSTRRDTQRVMWTKSNEKKSKQETRVQYHGEI